MKEKLSVLIFLLIIGGFFIADIVITPPEISMSERRPLAKLPELSFETVRTAEFMSKYETFAADSFAFRDTFRTIRAFIVFHVFRMTDKDGLYIGDSGAGKFEKINERSWLQTTEKIRTVGDTLQEAGLNVYYSIIPDKSIYSGRTFPGFDINSAREILSAELPGFIFIDISQSLKGGDFYRSDLHWSQPEIKAVADKLGNGMGFAVDFSRFSEVTAGDFKGVYAGQVALPMRADTMRYLTGSAITARYLDEKTLEWYEGDVYDLEAFKGRDPYDIFLKGPQPLIILENPNAASDRELYLFRDSFGSSIAPILAEAYGKITIIDLRYLDWRALPMFIEFNEGADALFLYGSQILNNSTVLLVR